MMSTLRIFLLSLLPMVVSSCSYHFGRGEMLERYSTVCVPYVEGDKQGIFTSTLIRQMTTSGALAYRSYGADLLLKVCLFEPIDRNIGFRFAPPDVGDNDFSNVVVSNEARLSLTARVTLIDRRTGECVWGPKEITTFLDYDFEPDLSNIEEQAFALGQLEMNNLAQDAAFPPLYTLLAQKIVDYVTFSW